MVADWLGQRGYSNQEQFVHVKIQYLFHNKKQPVATLPVNFAVSDKPAGNISKTKWHYYKANAQGLLCAANGIDWASISQTAHVND